MNAGIYIITNVITSKCYIGSAINIARRWSEHRNMLKKCKHPNKHLQSSYNLYSNDAFVYDVLAYCNKEDLLYYEQKCIDLLKPEYNICKIAGSRVGVKHSEETKAKMAEAHKGNTRSLGHKHSEETKAKMSISRKGNKPNLGKKHSDETKRKIGVSSSGRKHSEETIANMKNRTLTEEVKAKISKSNTGKIITEETRAKMSIAAKKRNRRKAL